MKIETMALIAGAAGIAYLVHKKRQEEKVATATGALAAPIDPNAVAAPAVVIHEYATDPDYYPYPVPAYGWGWGWNGGWGGPGRHRHHGGHRGGGGHWGGRRGGRR